MRHANERVYITGNASEIGFGPVRRGMAARPARCQTTSKVPGMRLLCVRAFDRLTGRLPAHSADPF